MHLLRQIGLLFALVCVLAGPARAQGDAVDIEAWNTLAGRVADTIENDASTEEVYTALRRQVVEYRSQFDTLRSANSERIAVLRQQLAALGPEPSGEGAAPEAPEVAAQRVSLNEQLAILLGPVQQAQAEFLRADALIGQIDQVLRERDTERLLTVGPSPLNPAHWQQAARDMSTSLRLLWAENQTQRSSRDRSDLLEIVPISLVLSFTGLLFILRGRPWSVRIAGSLRQYGARGYGVWRFVASLLRILLPFAGFALLVLAVVTTELFGPKGESILYTIMVLSGVMLGYRWVSDRVFAKEDDETLIQLPPEKRREIRFHVSVLTVLLAMGVVIRVLLDVGSPQEASIAVWLFPIFVLGALPLFRIGVLLRGYVDPAPDDQTGETEIRGTTLRRLVRLLGLGAVLVAIAAPVLAAAGFLEATRAIFQPYVITLVLLGLVMALQRFLADVYGAVTGQGVQARDALLPVLFGMVLLLAVSPVVALAWGARVTDLTELLQTIGRGFSIGETRISPTNFLTFAVIFVIGFTITRLLQSSLRTNVLPKTRIDIGGQNAIISGLGYVGIFLAALAAITGAGIDLSSLAIVAGALSVGIGFGLQNIVSNFVSGIILLIERPISEGDWIEVGDQMGYVRDISVRSTRIETFDRTDVIVPNADLVSGTVTNYTRGNTVGRVIVPVGVAYGTDTRRVQEILQEIAEAHPMVLAHPPPGVDFLGFGADALDFRIRAILRDVSWIVAVRTEMNHQIAERFVQEGIEIPFAQRDIWLRNPEALRAPDDKEPSA